MMDPDALRRQPIDYRLGDAADVGVRGARTDHEPVDRVVQPAQVQGDQIAGPEVVRGFQG